MYFVYILKLVNGRHYIGYTKDLKDRIRRHKNYSTKTTARIPIKNLLFFAAFKDKKKALNFEKYLKTSSGCAFRNKRLI